MVVSLHDIQRQLVERIGTAPVGSALRFHLMDAADAVSKAMEAEAKCRGAETADIVPHTTVKSNAGGPGTVAPNSESTAQ